MESASSTFSDDDLDRSIAPPVATALTTRIFGNLETDKTKRDVQATRLCHLTVTKLQLAQSSTQARLLQVGVSIGRSRRALRALPVELAAGSRGPLQLNVTFAFQYTACLKGGASDALRLHVEERTRAHLRPLAHGSVSLAGLLHAPFAGDVPLRPDHDPDASPPPSSPAAPAAASGTAAAPAGDVWGRLSVALASYPDDADAPEDAAAAWSEAVQADRAFKPPTLLPAAAGANDDEAEAPDAPSLAERIRKSAKRRIAAGAAAARGSRSSTPAKGRDDASSSASDAAGDSERDERERDFDELDEPLGAWEPPVVLAAAPLSGSATSSATLLATETELSPRGRAELRSSVEQLAPSWSEALQRAGPSDAFVLSGPRREGRKLDEWALQARRVVLLSASSRDDLAAATASLVARYQLWAEQPGAGALVVRVAVAGGDEELNEVLQSFVAQLGKKPKGWAGRDAIRFLLVPTRSSSQLAAQLAAHDAVYRSLFGADWFELMRRSEAASPAELELMEARVRRYLDEAVHPLRLEVGEALVTGAAGGASLARLQRTVAFLREVRVEVADERDDARPLQIDYWAPPAAAASAEKRKDEQATLKGFHTCCVSRLPVVLDALKIEPALRQAAGASAFVLQAEVRDKKAGKKGAPKADKRTGPLHKLASRITCSGAGLVVHIDGVACPAELVSLSSSWGTHVKTFALATFVPSPQPAPGTL